VGPDIGSSGVGSSGIGSSGSGVLDIGVLVMGVLLAIYAFVSQAARAGLVRAGSTGRAVGAPE
jgi:hypothetical protein